MVPCILPALEQLQSLAPDACIRRVRKRLSELDFEHSAQTGRAASQTSTVHSTHASRHTGILHIGLFLKMRFSRRADQESPTSGPDSSLPLPAPTGQQR